MLCVAALAAAVGCATTEEPKPAPAPAPALAPAPAPVPATPAPAPVAKPAPAPAKPAALRAFTSVQFAFNKSALDIAAQDKIDRELVVRLSEFSNIRFVNVAGFADRLGSQQYNQKLSERRAEAAKAYLVKQGIDGTKIEATGFGKAYMGTTLPVANCPDQKDRKALIDCLAPNRRAEVEVLGTSR
jgi:OOP family OmpA-OmpF porin